MERRERKIGVDDVVSRAWAIGSTKAMRKVGRRRKRRSSSKRHDSILGRSRRYPCRRLSNTPSAKLGAIRREKGLSQHVH